MAYSTLANTRRVIGADAEAQGWEVFVDNDTEALLLIRFCDGELIMLHVDLILDDADPDHEVGTRFVRAGVKSVLVRSPSEVGQFMRDLPSMTAALA